MNLFGHLAVRFIAFGIIGFGIHKYYGAGTVEVKE